MSFDADLEAIAADFALFHDWEERYAHIIELGRDLPPLRPEEESEANRVRGCASQVWLVADPMDQEGRLHFRANSDAHIVRGLIALALRLYSNRPPAEILAIDAKTWFQRLGLGDALTAQRANGLAALVQRIRTHAELANTAG